MGNHPVNSGKMSLQLFWAFLVVFLVCVLFFVAFGFFVDVFVIS